MKKNILLVFLTIAASMLFSPLCSMELSTQVTQTENNTLHNKEHKKQSPMRSYKLAKEQYLCCKEKLNRQIKNKENGLPNWYSYQQALTNYYQAIPAIHHKEKVKIWENIKKTNNNIQQKEMQLLCKRKVDNEKRKIVKKAKITLDDLIAYQIALKEYTHTLPNEEMKKAPAETSDMITEKIETAVLNLYKDIQTNNETYNKDRLISIQHTLIILQDYYMFHDTRQNYSTIKFLQSTIESCKKVIDSTMAYKYSTAIAQQVINPQVLTIQENYKNSVLKYKAIIANKQQEEVTIKDLVGYQLCLKRYFDTLTDMKMQTTAAETFSIITAEMDNKIDALCTDIRYYGDTYDKTTLVICYNELCSAQNYFSTLKLETNYRFVTNWKKIICNEIEKKYPEVFAPQEKVVVDNSAQDKCIVTHNSTPTALKDSSASLNPTQKQTTVTPTKKVKSSKNKSKRKKVTDQPIAARQGKENLVALAHGNAQRVQRPIAPTQKQTIRLDSIPEEEELI